MNALKSSEKARAKGGLATFLCPNRPGELRLTPATCAGCHKMAQAAQDADRVRLWECVACEVGAANLAAISSLPAVKRDRAPSYKRGGDSPKNKGLASTLVVALEFLRARGRATAPDAAKHFGLHRELMADRFASLERRGLVRRFKGGSKALIWEAV
jgi:hypothetical protein